MGDERERRCAAARDAAPCGANMDRPGPAIPADVQRFVLTSVPSVPFLEAVLLFRRHRARVLGTTDVMQALYLPEQTVLALLDRLVEAGMLASSAEAGAGWRYAPRDAPLADMLDRLAHAYAHDLVGISNLIHDGTRKSAERFAEAFKIRKEP